MNNEYKCSLCPRRLASKHSLERHIRLKHKSYLGEINSLDNNPTAKISRLADNSVKQGLESNRSNLGKYEYVPHVRKEGDSSDSEDNTDKGSDHGDAKLGNSNNFNKNNVIDANKAGWIESDNKKEIDNNNNSQGEDSNSMDTEARSNINDDFTSTKELVYKHNLFYVVKSSKKMCDRFKNCESVTTFRIHPPQVPIKCTNIYAKWLDNLFVGILEYLASKYYADPEDLVSLDIFHVDTNKTIWLWPKKRKELNVGDIVSEILKEKLTNPSGDLTIALNCIKSEVTCPTCGHTRISKDGVVYTK